MLKKISWEEIVSTINHEIDWCNEPQEYPMVTEEYRLGFIGGLIQAKYLIAKFLELQNEEN
jgi:hypothetical protein